MEGKAAGVLDALAVGSVASKNVGGALDGHPFARLPRCALQRQQTTDAMCQVAALVLKRPFR